MLKKNNNHEGGGGRTLSSLWKRSSYVNDMHRYADARHITSYNGKDTLATRSTTTSFDFRSNTLLNSQPSSPCLFTSTSPEGGPTSYLYNSQ